jgi:hypothetical protein
VVQPLLYLWSGNRMTLFNCGATMLVIACAALALGLGIVLPCPSAFS